MQTNNDGSGHTTDTEFSPELSANDVHGEVELCVLISCVGYKQANISQGS